MRPGYVAGKLIRGVALIFALYVGVGCQMGPQVPREMVRLAIPALEQNALMYIADDQGYFAQNGLAVTFRNYETGVATIHAVMEGEADLAEAAEFPFVRAVMAQQPVKIIASNDRFENDYLLARQDRGIRQVADLRGKRIALARQTIADFYLGRFLRLSGIAAQDVTIVDVAPAQFADAFGRDDVDALVAWQPYISQIQQKQGSQALTWRVQSNQMVYGVLIAGQSWLAAHTGTAERFLRALADAETYIARNPEQSQAIVRKRLGYDVSYMSEVWPQHRFSLSLDLSLVIAMDDEARWLTANNYGQPPAPNPADSIYADALRAVKPDAVNLAR